MKMFPNKDRECFISSLANLLLLHFNDFPTANNLFYRSREHPLVLPDGGTFISAWPYLVDELSGNRYRGTIYVSPDFLEKPDDEARKNYNPAQFSLYQRVKDESVVSRKIDLTGTYQGPPPVILSVGRKGYESSHAIVDIGNGRIIDNGERCKVDIFDDAYYFGAILKVEKKESLKTKAPFYKSGNPFF